MYHWSLARFYLQLLSVKTASNGYLHPVSIRSKLFLSLKLFLNEQNKEANMLHIIYPLIGDSDKSSDELMELFLDGGFFRTKLDGLDMALISMHDVRDGDEIRIVYGHIKDDFNFGDRHIIDRTLSIKFVVKKHKEASNV